MFETSSATDTTEVPNWSGEFMEVGNGVAIMRVHNSDERQHFPPSGWVAAGHNTFDDGTFEVYVYFRVDA